MPKGEHFKKNNPRNTQVSFKVNEKEWERLQEITAQSGMSIPQWIRSQIEKYNKPIPNKPATPSVKKNEQMSLF